MKKWDKWKKRILVFVVTGCMLLDSDMAVLAEETQKVVSNLYDEYQTEQLYKKQYEETVGQVQPEQSAENNDDSKKNLKDAEVLVESAFNEKEQVSLRLPEITKYTDEKEAELTGLYGEPVEVKEHEKVFQVDATHYVTLLTSEANTHESTSGEMRPVDLTLIPKDIEGKEEVKTPTEEEIRDPNLDLIYEPKDSSIDVSFPANVTEERGIEITNKEHTLELFPQEGTYGNATTKDHALLYNSVQENIDVQYSVDTTGVKEDIILREKTEQNEFQYLFDAKGYDVESKDNQIFIREKGKNTILFVLSAPLMSDSDGSQSQKIEISAEKQSDGHTYMITVRADKEWLLAEERVYPVKIDPTVTVPTESLIEVTTSTVHGTYHGAGYGYAGYITSAMTGVPGAKDIGRSRMYFAVNYDFRKSIPSEAKIDSASLNVYQYVDYPQTNATFACYRINSPWNAGSLTWDNSVGLSLEPSGENAVSVHKHGMHQFDIRETVNNWVQGITDNNGLVVMATNETNLGGAFYTPYSTGTDGQVDFSWDKRPSITINWSVPDPVNLNYGLNDTTVALRSMVLTDKSGKLQFQGVFADGIATPGAMVGYALNDEKKDYQGVSLASYSYKYPDSSSFDSAFSKGTTKYKDKLGNWQTVYPFTEPEFNVLYYISGTAAKDGIAGQTKKSDDFTIYKVTQYDTLPKIANYYGIPLAKIMHDNRVQDMLLVENNTLFIRNPKKNATVPYNPPALDDTEKAKIDAALMGRGLHCEFGFEPVNLNTGNFYLNRTDVSIPDYTDDFVIERNYNSKGAELASVFGRGWSFDYTEQITKDKDGNLHYRRGDGSILVFTEKDGEYTAPDGYELKLNQKKIKENTFDFGEGEESYPVYQYTITDETNVTKTFNYFGMLTSIEDEKGNQTVLTYDDNYNLREITSPAGIKYEFTTNEEGYITAIQLPNGSTLSYAYDGNGNLISYTDANGAVTRYEYDDAHRMTAWYDANGMRIVQNVYDDQGRVTTQTDANGGVSSLAYKDGQTVATDANGNQTVYYYDDQMRTVKVKNPDSTTRTMEYNAENQLESETDELGHTTGHQYDEAGNETCQTRFDGKKKTWDYDENHHVIRESGYDGIATEYTYDKSGNLLTITIAGKLQHTYTVDAQGRILTDTDANGNTITYTYSGARLITMTDAKGNRTSYSYNAHGLLTEMTDTLGGVTVYTYDAEGRKTGETSADGEHTGYTFDASGNVMAVTDGNGNTVSFAFDGMGNKIKADNGTGGTYSYTYDAVGNQTSLTDAEGNTTTYTYNVRGNKLTETDAAGDTITYTYDALGNILTQTDENGNTTSYTYDYAQNQVNSVTDAAGEQVSYTFQEDGLPTQITYPQGTSDSYTYDELARTTSYTDEGGLTTRYTYDDNGNVLTEDADGQVTSYKYDRLNNRTKTTYPDGTAVSYKYDVLGHLKEMTDANGNTTTYHYSSDGKLLELTDALGNTTKVAYDGNGNQTSLTDAAGNTSSTVFGTQNQPKTVTDALGNVTTYRYNQMEQLIELTDALGGKITYTYNKKGLPSGVTDGGGNTYEMTYTATGLYDTITAPDGTTVKYEYNRLNQPVKETRSSGLVTEYEYDAKGRVTHTWDNEGFEETYEYDVYGNKSSVTNAFGEETRYSYDKYQRLVKVVEADGAKNTYTYDEVGNLTEATDAEGKITTYTYDANGNVTQKEDSSGRIWKYSYNVLNQLTEEINPAGERTSYTYDVLGNLTGVTDANGNTETYGYNALSLPVIHTDKNGNDTLFTYDALQRLTKITTAEGGEESYAYDAAGNQIRYTDAEGNVTETAYDNMNRKVGETLPNGGTYAYEYDGNGSLSKETDPLGNVTSYKNNLHGQVTSKILPNGAEYTYAYDKLERITGQTAPQGLKKSYTYDIAGNLIRETDQSDRSISYEYDIMGRLKSVENPLGQKTAYTYDENGNLSSQVSPMGNTVRYSYDKLDRLEETLDPAGRKESYTYDSVGNLTKKTVNDTRVTSYAYDANGNLTSLTNALGQTETKKYDNMNRLVQETDATGAKTTYQYDGKGQLLSSTDGNGNTTAVAYDGNGNVISVTDGEGRQVRYAYDLADRLTEAMAGDASYENRNTYTYDEVGNLTSTTDGNGNKMTYTYDLLSNQTSRTNALGETESYSYNLNNRLEKITRPNGNTIQYDYNKLDALLQTDYSEEADGQVLYTYDEEGKRLSMSDLTGTSTYQYDADGRITGVQQGDGSVILYNYDSYGNLAKLIYPDGSEVQYEYDALDRLIKVTDREGKETGYTYDVAGNMTEVLRANQTSAKLTYDAAHQVTEIQNRDAKGKTISTYRYTYDLSGYILTESIKTKKETKVSNYGYDAAGQLSEIVMKDSEDKVIQRVTYAYDGAGNKIEVRQSTENALEQATETIIKNTYNAANRLVSSEQDGKETTYIYDANGNRVRELNADEKTHTYTYDTENRLIAVRDEKGLLMAALYDGDSNRMFTANRTEDTKEYQLFKEKKKSPKTSDQGREGSMFWYGFGQNFLQGFQVAKESIGQTWRELWEDLVSAYHRKIAKDRADEEGIVVNPDGITNMPGAGEVTYPSETSQALIPYKVVTDTYDYFESRNYVNDINQQYTQVLTAYDENGKVRETYTYGNERLDYSDGTDTYYYGYTGTGSVDHLTNTEGILETAYSYDAFGNVSVSGNTEIQNPYTYNAEYIDASTGNQYLRARYYDLEEGIFLTQDSYLGSLLEPLSQNLYTYAENNPVNYSDPSGHGILSKIKSAAKKVTTTVKNTYNKAKTWVKNTYNKAKNWVSNTYQNAKKALTNVVSSSGSSEKNKSGKSSSGGRYSSGGSNAGNRKYSSSSRGSSKSNFYRPSTYERAKRFGQSRYNWFSSKMKESGNIRNSWTKAIEKTVRKFCTTASRIKKDAVKSVKAANIAIGISAITIGKMKLEQLKKKLPNINISIDYTGTWKDSLQLGLGIVTTGGGLLLTLAGGGSEIASVGSSSAISIPVATEGIAIAGTGLAISGSALANMFDVRIQKSESNKGKGDGESGNSSNELKDVYNSIKDSPDYPKEFEAVKNGTTKNTIKNKELLDKLREIESGKWTKVYKDGYDSSGNKISIHYFQSESGKVFNVKVKPGWSN